MPVFNDCPSTLVVSISTNTFFERIQQQKLRNVFLLKRSWSDQRPIRNKPLADKELATGTSASCSYLPIPDCVGHWDVHRFSQEPPASRVRHRTTLSGRVGGRWPGSLHAIPYPRKTRQLALPMAAPLPNAPPLLIR